MRSELQDGGTALADRPCPAPGAAPALDAAARARVLLDLPGWECKHDTLVRDFGFGRYRDVLRFVQGVGEMAEELRHHPMMRVGYRVCTVEWTTHRPAGLSELDAIAAARTDRLAAGLSGQAGPGESAGTARG